MNRRKFILFSLLAPLVVPIARCFAPHPARSSFRVGNQPWVFLPTSTGCIKITCYGAGGGGGKK